MPPARRVLEHVGAAVCAADGEPPPAAAALPEKLLAYVAHLPRASRAALAVQLAALDHGARLYRPARGRRLADLGGATARRYLLRLFDGPLAGVLQPLRQVVALCWFDLPSVREALGYEPDAHIARVARRRTERHGDEIRAVQEAVTGQASLPTLPPERHLDGGRLDGETRLRCDVVVVGTGAGGATMAAELAGAGIDVLMVEEGEHHPTGSFSTDMTRAMGTLYRAGGVQTIVGRPPVMFLEGRCVGGSTVVNGGMCWRTPPAVLERWSREHAVAGLTGEAMDRHFATVEERLSISPQASESIGRDARLLEQGALARGWALERSRRNQLHCGGCDTCFAGCPTGAKRSMLVTNVPRALHLGARLVTGCRVDRVTREGRRATGVEGTLTATGRGLRVEARVVVAACGGLQTPALLARSGFRSASGALGRNLALHPSATLVALFDEDVDGWRGVHQAFQVTEFLGEGILVTASTLPPALVAAGLQQTGPRLADVMAGYRRMVVAGCLIEDTSLGRVRWVPGIGPVGLYGLTHEGAQRAVRGIGLAAEAMFAAGARRVLLPVLGAGEPLDADATRRLLAAPIRRERLQLFTVHAMGTARMSDDPARGVVGSHGAFHGAAGLFVADASVLPGPVGVNPMQTIVALASRSAERLVHERRVHGI